MMLHRQPFLQLQEEDLVLLNILTNSCVVEKDVSKSFVLELITYEKCDKNGTFLKELEILYSLLPCELEATPISEATMIESTTTIELTKGHNLHVNPKLTPTQMEQLKELLQRHEKAFAWDYSDMKGLSPTLCTHRIYINEECLPLYQPQRRINPSLREIIKTKLQKLLDANFIYPIFDSRWVSPLFIVPKKGGKWWICVDYRELNKATKIDHFPLPFIDQVLDTLVGKKYFSFLDGYSGYNQISIATEDQDKTTFTCP